MCLTTHLKKFLLSLGRISRGIVAEIAEPVRVTRINRKLADAPIDDADIKALAVEDLRKLVESEWIRAKELDDKLQKLTAALSVSVTVGALVATTILQDLALPGLKVVAGGLFLLAALFLFGGVLLGFNGLRPKPRYGYGATFMRKLACTEGTVARDTLIAAASGFQRDNMIRANETSAAVASIRNGIVVFVVAVLVGLVAATVGKTLPAVSIPAAQTHLG